MTNTTTSYWGVSASGDWFDSSDWSSGVPNGYTDNAVISEPGTYTVTISDGEIVQVNDLGLDSANATLAVDYILHLNGVLALASGELIDAGAIGAGGALVQSGGTIVFDSGASLSSSQWDLSGGTVTLAASFNYDGPLDQTGGTIPIPTGETLTISGTGSTFEGQISGAGTLDIAGSGPTIGEGASLTVSNWIVSTSPGPLTIAAPLSYGGTLTVNYGDSLVISAGSTLTVSGSLNVDGSIDGFGTLLQTAGTTTFGSGELNASNWVVSGGTVTAGNLIYAGVLDDVGGTMNGNFWLAGPQSTIDATISGADLFLDGGTATIESGASISETNFSIGSSTTILETSLSNSTGFAVSSGTLDITSGNKMTVSGVTNIEATIDGAGTFAETGGTTTMSGYMGVSNWSISGGTTTITAPVLYAGAFSETGGTLDTPNGYALTLEGISTIAGTIAYRGTLALDGTTTIDPGANLTCSYWNISGGTTTFATPLSYSGTLGVSGGTLDVSSGDALSLSGTSTIAGTVGGAGTFALVGGTTALESGAIFTVADWTISGGTTTIETPLAYSGAFLLSGGTLDVSSGDTLTLSGTTTIQGLIHGEGTLAFGGGAAILDAGAAVDTAALSLSNSATLGLKENFSFAGVVSQADGTSISVGPGSTLTLSCTGSILDGTITGKGTLLLDGGTDTLTGTTMQVSDWTLASGTVVTLGTDIVYDGVLTEEAGTTLSLGSKVLTLMASSSTFAGAITGTAAFDLKGGTQEFDAGATISTAHWNLSGKDAITIDEDLTFAGTFSSGNGTKIAVSSGDTLDLTGDATISSKISGVGTLEFSGGSDGLGKGAGITATTLDIETGASLSIAAKVKDTGALDISSGSSLVVSSHDSFDLTQGATGAGIFIIDSNATLDLGSSVASTLTANFDGAGATLGLSDLSDFAATILGFATADTIDLLKVKITSATLQTGDVLVLMHGSTTVGTLQLSGNYAGDTFSATSDEHGGTDITTDAASGSLIMPSLELHTSHADWIFG
jgi:fibronectin-binding autotransporter adhesin